MKNIPFLIVLLPLFLVAQNKNRSPVVGLFCSTLESNSRWCFTFDSTGKVTAQLSDRTVKTVLIDFLPYGFSDEYTATKDTIMFRSYIEDFGTKEYPAEYRYNYFTAVIKGSDIELLVEGKNSGGEKRQKKVTLHKIK